MNRALMRFILIRYLYKEDIQDLLDDLGLPVSGAKGELIERLTDSGEFDPASALSYLRADELAELCDEFGIPSNGNRASLTRRIEEAVEE